MTYATSENLYLMPAKGRFDQDIWMPASMSSLSSRLKAGVDSELGSLCFDMVNALVG